MQNLKDFVRLASIDVGSNAMRLEIVEIPLSDIFNYKPSNSITNLKLKDPGRVRIPVRLGYEAFSQGYFSEEKIEEVIAAFQYFKHELVINDVDYYLTACTSASREAVNGSILSKIIQQEIGIKYRIIDGLEEARLLNLALAPYYPSSMYDDMYIDLGGGSLEINIREKGSLIYQDSLKLGTVRLMIESQSEDKMIPVIKSKLEKIKNFFKKNPIQLDYYLVPGGNAEDLVRLGKKFFNFESGKERFIPITLLSDIINLVKPIKPNLRSFRFNLRPDRSDVIVQAGTIFQTIAEYANVDKMHVPEVNLNDGIIYDLIERMRRLGSKNIEDSIYSTKNFF